jgi:hypothetical protein
VQGHIDGEVWHLKIRGEMVETPFEGPAYNGELPMRLDWRKDNTVGSLTETQVAVMTP